MPLFVFNLDDTLVNTSRDLGGGRPLISNLTLVDGATEFLKKCGNRSVILSCGVETLQQQKIDHVGLRDLVRQVVIVPTVEKKNIRLAMFASEADRLQCDVVVVGDRVDQEIRMGNALGCITVRMRLPDGKHRGDMPIVREDRPTYIVSDFFEFLRLPLRF